MECFSSPYNKNPNFRYTIQNCLNLSSGRGFSFDLVLSGKHAYKKKFHQNRSNIRQDMRDES